MNELKELYPALALVFLSMLVIMFAFELVKQVLSPAITLWESHAATIVFTSVVAIVLMYFPFRSSYREQQKTEEALRLRQEAEENQRKSEMQYRSFVESVDESIYTVDRDFRYLLVNTRHLVRMGITPNVYTGKRYADFHSPAETHVFEELVQKVAESKRPVQDEYEKDGQHFLRKFSPVTDPLINEVIAVTIISSEITGRKLAEKNLAAINRKLNLVNDITSHDILNQLTVLNSLLNLAEDQSKETVTKEYLQKGGGVIETIHAQILFARDYQKIGVESPQWQNISQTIQKARLLLKLQPVAIDDSCGEWEICADPLLEKVFYNLIENAVRYSGNHPEIRFSVWEEPGRLVLACEDNGPGVSEENKEKIFQRGFGNNTGLGLFLVRGILAMTGISIRENGTEGKGSRFEIAVPSGAYRTAKSG
jgi:PAS domain S-box-containing protein